MKGARGLAAPAIAVVLAACGHDVDAGMPEERSGSGARAGLLAPRDRPSGPTAEPVDEDEGSFGAALEKRAPGADRALASADASAGSWAERERRAYVLQAGIRGRISDVAFSVRGDLAAVAYTDGTVALIDVERGQIRSLTTITRGAGARRELAIADRTVLVRDSDLSSVTAWSWRDGNRVELELEELSAGAPMALAPRGDRLVYAGGHALRIVSLRDGAVVARRQGGARILWWPSPGLILAAREGTVAALEPRTLATIWEAPARDVAIRLPRADRVALLDGDTVVLRALPSGAEMSRMEHRVPGAARILFSREGHRIAVVSAERSVIVALERSDRIVVPDPVRWLSDRDALVGRRDGSVWRWNLDRQHLAERVAEPAVGEDDAGPEEAAPRNATWYASSGALLSVRGLRVELRDAVGNGHPIAIDGEHAIWDAQMAPDGSMLVIGGRFGVQVWSADGVRDVRCDGAHRALRIDWEQRVLISDERCDLGTGTRQRLFGPGVEAIAVSADGRFVLGNNGDLVDLHGGARVPHTRFPHVGCDDPPECEAVRFAPGVRAFAVTGHDPVTGTLGPTVLFDGRADRRLAEIAPYRVLAFAPDGAYLAHAGTRSLRLVELGALPDERSLVGRPTGDEPEGPLAIALAPSPDGRRIAWTRGRGDRVELVSVEDGVHLGTLEVGEPVLELRWSEDGNALALRTERAIRVHASATGELIEALDDARGSIECACVGGRWTVLRDAARGGFERVDAGACGREDPMPRLSASRRHLVWIDHGIVRVRRLEDGAELVLRTAWTPQGPLHFAHDAEGRFWTPASPTEAAPVPAWVYVRISEAEPRPLDPALARRDLLRSFFGPGA